MKKLPQNPNTISDLRPKANEWTVESISAKYIVLPCNAETRRQIVQDLAELRAWDDYEGHTSEQREAVKDLLKRMYRLATQRINQGFMP